MTSRARLVQFVPDPFEGSRYTIGAILATDGDRRFIAAGRLPDAAMLGSATTRRALDLVIETLTTSPMIDIPPPGTGWLVVYEDLAVPVDAADPDDWVRRHVLPRAAAVA